MNNIKPKKLQTDELFRLVVEAASNAMIVVDSQRHIVLVNKGAEKLFGYRREELVDQFIEMLIPENFRDRHPEYVTQFFLQPQTRAMGTGRELFGLCKDGREVPIEIGLNPIETEFGLFTLASIIDITERRQAEKRFRLAVEAAPNAMLMIDVNRQIVLVNRKVEDLFGYSRYELIGKTIEFLVPERFRAKHPGLVENFFAEPKARAMGAGRELFGQCKNGTEVPIEIGLNPIETSEGLCTLASIIDITERKRAEVSFRLVVEAAPNAMLMIDKSHRITLINRKTEDVFGYKRDELIGQSIEILVPERFRLHHTGFIKDFLFNPVARAMGAGRELFGRCKDGHEVPIEIGLNPIETPEGRFTLASIIDIAERKRAEAESLAAIVESSEDAIIGRSLTGVITSWNKSAERIFGYTIKEAIGQPMSMMLSQDHVQEESLILDRIQQGERIDHFETVRRQKNGNDLDVSVAFSPIYDVLGRIVGVSTIERDITELQKIRKELLLAKDTAEVANRELESFSYSVAHDLRSPLRSIDGFSQALLEDCGDKLDAIGKKYLGFLRDSAQLMAQLIDDLLALSRVTRSGLKCEQIDLSALAREVQARLARGAPMRKVDFKLEEGVIAYADPRLLSIVFDNLIGNSWKFTNKREHACIEFGVMVDKGKIIYFVRDNGAGFDMTYAGKLFGAFQRLHSTRDFEGTGIGLATVQRIIYRHGGRIWADGQVNVGATFYFTLNKQEC